MNADDNPNLFAPMPATLSAGPASPEKQTVVVCPRDRMPAAVGLDAGQRLIACSRRKEQETCEEQCSPQLHYTSDDLATFLRNNTGKTCSRCGSLIGPNDWYGSRTAKLGQVGRSVSTIASAADRCAPPICFSCLAE